MLRVRVVALGALAALAAVAGLAAYAPAAPGMPALGPSRIKTWYYYGLNDVNKDVPPEVMARYAEFVEDDGDKVEHATRFKAAGGRYAVSYTDPAYVPYCFPPFIGTATTCRGQVGRLIHDERAWFHGPDGTRVRRYIDAHFGYQQAINPESAAARAAWRETTEAILRNGPIDFFLADDSGGPLHARDMSPKSSEFYDFNEAGVEITSDAVFRDQWIAYLSYAAKPLILNGYDPTDGKPSYGGAFLRASFVAGGEHEGCFRHNDGPVDGDARWLQQENGLLATTALGKYAVCFVLGTPTPPTRTYALASWWPAYEPMWSVFAPIVPVAGETALLPETEIVPLYPVRTAAQRRLTEPERRRAGSRASPRLLSGRPLHRCVRGVVNPTSAQTAFPRPLRALRAHAVLDREDLFAAMRALGAGRPSDDRRDERGDRRPLTRQRKTTAVSGGSETGTVPVHLPCRRSTCSCCRARARSSTCPRARASTPPCRAG